MPVKALLQTVSYSQSLLVENFGDGAAVAYLHGYLSSLRVACVLKEEPYIDRHYLEDFANYYARSFETPPAACGRLHFFCDLTSDQLLTKLKHTHETPQLREQTQSELQEAYLGFVVRRPLEDARIGRTVLKTYAVEGRRHYEVVRPYEVHVAGFRIIIRGLAYQQQDGGAAVCASTALWSALQRVAFVTGNRTPPPSKITAAAKSPFPASHGLQPHQMAEAISSLGYVADQFSPGGNRPLFRAKLIACLQSHLPVILLLSKRDEAPDGTQMIGHAVTVTGYSEHPDPFTVNINSSLVKMKSAGASVLYVHDDNIGCHAHYELTESDDSDEEGNRTIALFRGRASGSLGWMPNDSWTVFAALVPKPDKLRLPIENLFLNILWLSPPITTMAFPGIDLIHNVRFVSGLEYRNALWEMNLDARISHAFQMHLTLPRHVAVLTYYVPDGTSVLFELVLDASEKERSRRKMPALALIAPGVSAGSIGWARLTIVAQSLGALFISGPPSPSPLASAT